MERGAGRVRRRCWLVRAAAREPRDEVMRKIRRIMQREYVEAVRKRTFVLSTVIVPLAMIGLIFVSIYFAEKEPDRTLHVAVYDKTSKLAPRLAEAMDDTLSGGRRRFAIEIVGSRGRSDAEVKENLRERIENETLDAFLLIPADVMSDGVAEFYARSVGVLGYEANFRRALREAVMVERLAQRGLPADLLRESMRTVPVRTLLIEKGAEKESAFEMEYAVTMAAVMILYMTIVVHGRNILTSVLEEKSSRVIEIILSSVSALELMVGKILGTAMVSLTQYAIWVVAGLAIAFSGAGAGELAVQLSERVSMGEVAYLVGFFVLGFLLFGTAYAAIGAMCNTEQEANNLQTPLIMMLVFPLIVGGAVIQDPSGLLARIFSYVPFSAPVVMFMRISVSDVSPFEIGLSVLVIVVSIAVMFWVVARIFRVGILMYGKRPSLPELVRWIRYA